MTTVAADWQRGTGEILDGLRLARIAAGSAAEPNLPQTREAGIEFESSVGAEVQKATDALKAARTRLHSLIDNPALLPDETLRAGIQYWAAVRALIMSLRLHRTLHASSRLFIEAH